MSCFDRVSCRASQASRAESGRLLVGASTHAWAGPLEKKGLLCADFHWKKQTLRTARNSRVRVHASSAVLSASGRKTGSGLRIIRGLTVLLCVLRLSFEDQGFLLSLFLTKRQKNSRMRSQTSSTKRVFDRCPLSCQPKKSQRPDLGVVGLEDLARVWGLFCHDRCEVKIVWGHLLLIFLLEAHWLQLLHSNLILRKAMLRGLRFFLHPDVLVLDKKKQRRLGRRSVWFGSTEPKGDQVSVLSLE